MSDGTQQVDAGQVDQSDFSPIDRYEQEYTPVDNPSNAVKGDSVFEEDAPKVEPTKPQPTQTTTPEEGKQANLEGKEVEPTQTTPKTLSEITEAPKGFKGLLFSQNEGEDGVKYNRDKALGFLLPKDNSLKYKYENKVKFAEKPEAPTTPKTPEEKRQARITEEVEFKQNLVDNKIAWKTPFYEAIQAGRTAQEAEAYADSVVQKSIDDELNKRALDREFSMQDNFSSEAEKKQTLELNKQQAVSNEGVLINHIAKQFDMEPTNAAKEYGNLLKDYGGDFIRSMFDWTNQDKLSNISETEYNSLLNDWWTNQVASDMPRLQMVFDIALKNLNADLLPYNIEQGIHNQENLNNQNKQARMRPPTNRSRTPNKVANEHQKVAEYFNGSDGVQNFT